MSKSRKIHGVLQQKMRELFVTYGISSMGTAFILMFDSMIAGLLIGTKALSAIGLMAPFLLIDECLHKFITSGVSYNCAKIRVQEGKKASNRYFAASILTVIVIYGVVVSILLIFAKDIIGFFTQDKNVIKFTLDYYYPVVAAMPFFEVLLCTEYAYSIDGKARLFGLRPVISSIMNIVLDLLFVKVFHMEMLGIALATLCSTLFGYSVLLIHRLSGDCTVHPDFTVICSKKELLNYAKLSLNFGKEYALWNAIEPVCIGLLNKILVFSSGLVGLAIFTMIRSIMNVFFSMCCGIAKSLKLIFGVVVLSDKKQSRKILYETVKFSFFSGFAFALLMFIFAKPLCFLYGAPADAMTIYISGLRTALCFAPMYILSQVAIDYFLIIKKVLGTRLISLSMSCLSLVTAYLGAFFKLKGVIIGYYGIDLLIVLVLAVLYFKGGKLLPSVDESVKQLLSLDFINRPDRITDASRKVQQALVENGFSNKFAFRTSLVVEESCMMIGMENMFNSKTQIYICLYSLDNKAVMMLSDNGQAFDLVKDIELNSKSGEQFTEEVIIGNFADNIEYDRILEMNRLKFSMHDTFNGYVYKNP